MSFLSHCHLAKGLLAPYLKAGCCAQSQEWEPQTRGSLGTSGMGMGVAGVGERRNAYMEDAKSVPLPWSR